MIQRQASKVALDAIAIPHIFACLHFDQIPGSIFERAWKNLQDQRKNTQLGSAETDLQGSSVLTSFFYAIPKIFLFLRYS